MPDALPLVRKQGLCQGKLWPGATRWKAGSTEEETGEKVGIECLGNTWATEQKLRAELVPHRPLVTVRGSRCRPSILEPCD